MTRVLPARQPAIRGAELALRAVIEPGLGSSADGKGEEGIDRSFERTATPKYLAE